MSYIQSNRNQITTETDTTSASFLTMLLNYRVIRVSSNFQYTVQSIFSLPNINVTCTCDNTITNDLLSLYCILPGAYSATTVPLSTTTRLTTNYHTGSRNLNTLRPQLGQIAEPHHEQRLKTNSYEYSLSHTLK